IELPWRQAHLVQRGPELVLPVSVISLLQRRLPARGGAAEDQLQTALQPVGKNGTLGKFRHIGSLNADFSINLRQCRALASPAPVDSLNILSPLPRDVAPGRRAVGSEKLSIHRHG